MARRGASPAGASSEEDVRATFSRVRASVSRFGEPNDVVQEAYARAVSRRVQGDLEPWLRTVARRIAIDNARRRREFAAGAGADVDSLRTPAVPTPEDVVMAKEGVGLIRRAVQSLPSRYRDALLTYSEHRDNSAVAARLGLSPNAAGSLLCRARMRLREELDRVGYAAGAVMIKFQRWTDVAATATAAACFVAVMSGPSTAPPRAQIAEQRTAAAPILRTTGRPASLAAADSATPGKTRRVSTTARAEQPADPVEIVRYELEACTRNGRRVPTAYMTVIREGRRSLVGALTDGLPRTPRPGGRTCR